MIKPDDFECLADFEDKAILAKEGETYILIHKIRLAHFAIAHDDNHRDEDSPPRLARYLAHLWGCSAQSINTLARVFETFDEDEIAPDVPLSLWNAVMETDNPSAWLEKAIAEGLSARQVRDETDNLRGKHLSRCKFEGEVEVTVWEPATGEFGVINLPISGEKPVRVRVKVQEVLE